jgi:hypothetical protein
MFVQNDPDFFWRATMGFVGKNVDALGDDQSPL